MTGFIEFELPVLKPRREFVGLKGSKNPMPETLDLFERYLRKAVDEGRAQMLARYGEWRRTLEITAKHGHARIGALHIKLSDTSFTYIMSNVSEGSPLWPVYLEWKFLQHGRVLQYYERRDQRPERTQSIDQAMYGGQIQGVTRLRDVARDASFQLPKIHDVTAERLEKIRAARLRTPIVHSG